MLKTRKILEIVFCCVEQCIDYGVLQRMQPFWGPNDKDDSAFGDI